MNLNLRIDIITIVYKPNQTEVFKSASMKNDGEGDMNSIEWKTIPFDITEDDRKFAEANGCMYDDEMNAEGFEELHRFLSYVGDCDFFDIKYTSKTVTV